MASKTGKSFKTDSAGATAIEYGVMAGILGLGLIGIATSLEGQTAKSYAKLSVSIGKTQGLS